MRRAVWGLPQMGILANKQLRHKLAPFGYYKSTNTPGLWRHESRPLTFTLVVNNFGVKFVNKADVDHLISSIKKTYTLTEAWTGNLYCGIMLRWDYVGRTVNILMPGYIKMKLQEYEHIMPKNYKRVHTRRSQRNSARRPRPPSPTTRCQNLTQKASNVCRKSWGAFCIMRGRSI
jgi:hypothetical protein